MTPREPLTAELGDLSLESGETLHDAAIVYQTHGTLAPDGGNVILYPTWFLGTHTENEWLIGKGMTLDPDRWFIIIPNMIGNGVSTSPSNASGANAGAGFPLVTVRDQVRAQHCLLEQLGITRLQAVVGWSMAALQAFEWAVAYPGMVERIFPFCGAARTSEHNHVFLDGVAATIKADGTYAEGRYERQPLAGLTAAATVYAGWGFSQAFYRRHLYRDLGFADRNSFVDDFWVRLFTGTRDANDVLSMIRTWKSADPASDARFGGDLAAALGSITARTIVLSAERDLYFCVEDQRAEVEHIPGGEFRIIPGDWGHSAGVGLNTTDTRFIDAALTELLAR